MTPDPAWAYNRRRLAEAQLHSLRVMGQCISNPQHVCPTEYLDRTVPTCECPCHGESVI